MDLNKPNGVDYASPHYRDASFNPGDNVVDTFLCKRCEKTLPSEERTEHEDWHFAMDLQSDDQNGNSAPAPTYASPDNKHDTKGSNGTAPTFAPPSGPPPNYRNDSKGDTKSSNGTAPGFAPPKHPPPNRATNQITAHRHTNQVIEAGKVRARDEQEMQNLLQNLQYQYNIYNPEIEPEHETEFYCGCPIHNYQRIKWNRYGVQEMWSKAVMYPGEKSYNDSPINGGILFSRNPYQGRIIGPYGFRGASGYYGVARPQPGSHAKWIHQVINMNNRLNADAQNSIDSKEPTHSIWDDDVLEKAMTRLSVANTREDRRPSKATGDVKYTYDKDADNAPATSAARLERPGKVSKLASFKKSMGMKTTEEKAVIKTEKAVGKGNELKEQILAEENGRWPDDQWRYIVAVYQEKVGMGKKIADLRERHPIQYLHLLRAGYFEPIPVAWANQASNPLKFSIESTAGWRGVTPAWRGYEDTAEERLYWVLNHREGSVGMRMKPDFISEMTMARDRMARAVEPPPQYFDPRDTCHVQHTSEGYSKQVPPAPFLSFDRPEVPTDDTMMLLDVSGSMDFDPVRPNYNQYLITGYSRSTQPKNKDLAKAIIRRFTDAMSNHDHPANANAPGSVPDTFKGYDLVTFSSSSSYIGTINHANLDTKWRSIKIGGGTRVMTGWQKVKDLHFQKHSESATHHPIYGWQAGPQTPMLRLLLLLDGEATDMDEFELDLLGLSWAHVTIFLIGVDGCPHHHRHANELQRISDVNHHVSFVDAQGNTPERFVTHELLKRHLGYEVSMEEFQRLEELPAYSE